MELLQQQRTKKLSSVDCHFDETWRVTESINISKQLFNKTAQILNISYINFRDRKYLKF